MRKVLLCAPNVSEGRDPERLEEIVAAVRSVEGVRLLEWSADAAHHRAVLTYLGEPNAVLAATVAMAERALALIDMREHAGGHPRLGAVDVVPFVPVLGVSEEEAIEVARRFGRWVGARGIPVYYYEAAATRPERRDLPALRTGEYEGLQGRLATEAGAPDEGPAGFDPRAGAVVTGVRPPLLAFNVNLRSTDLELARRIARAVRFIGGGWRHVRAIGVELPDRGMVQVSMNLTRPSETPLARVLATVREEAARHGVTVAGTEVVGPITAEVLAQAFRHLAGAHDFRTEQVVELALLEEETPPEAERDGGAR